MILKNGYKLIRFSNSYLTIAVIITPIQIQGATSARKVVPSLFTAALECNLEEVKKVINNNYHLIDAVCEDPGLIIPSCAYADDPNKGFVSTLLTWAARTTSKAAIDGQQVDDTRVVEYLLTKGAHLDALAYAINLSGVMFKTYSRPLLVALQHGNYRIARLLIERQAWQHEATIHSDLICLGCVDGLRQLLDYETFNKITASEDSLSLLALAARYGQVGIANFLHSINHDVNQQIGPLHHTALHEAAKRLQPTMVRWLVSYGANVNATKTFGFTALHEVATTLKNLSEKKLLDENSLHSAKSILELLISYNAQDGPYEPPHLTACQLLEQAPSTSSLAGLFKRTHSLLILCTKAIIRFRNNNHLLFTRPKLVQSLPEELHSLFVVENPPNPAS